MNLANSKILITGGAGFIGSYVTEYLLKEGVSKIVILDNFVRGSKDNIEKAIASGKVELIEGDIRDTKTLNTLMAGMDYCYHLAALRITQCAQEPRHALEVMYDGTFNVLEACVAHKIKKLIFASSASVYGQAQEFPTKETHHPYNNFTLYGAAKMSNELMCRSFSYMHGLPFVALRFFNIYGPRMDTYGKYTEVFIRWYNLIKEGKPPVIFGDGSQTMDFIYVEDIARSCILALKSQAANEAYNIASGKETSLKQLSELLLKTMNSSLKPEHKPLPEERKKVEVMRRLADVSKAKKDLGFEVSVSLEEGLKRLVVWLDAQKAIGVK